MPGLILPKHKVATQRIPEYDVDEVQLREPRLMVTYQSPQSRVVADRNHELGRSLVRGWMLNGSLNEIGGNSTDNGFFVNGTAAYFSPCRYGMAAYLDGANPGTVIGIRGIGAFPSWGKNRDFTIGVVCVPEVLTGNAVRRGLFSMGITNFQIGLTTAGQVNCSDSQIADIGTTSGIAATAANRLTVVSASIAGSNALSIWLNGQKGLSITTTRVLNDGNSTLPTIGAEHSTAGGGGYYEEFKGWFLSAFYFGVAFSDGQHAAFQADPYQFLIPA